MELVRGLYNLRPEHRGCAATIGSFDGVHLGHQAVLAQLAEQGRKLQLPVTLITFEPQPYSTVALTGLSVCALTTSWRSWHRKSLSSVSCWMVWM